MRDVGRVMGLPYAEVDRVAKLVPDMEKSLGEAAQDGRQPGGRDGARPEDPRRSSRSGAGSRV